jgi:hypothetical protein
VSDNCYGRNTSPPVDPTEEQKERIARHKQLVMQRFAEHETTKTAENTAAEDSSGASTDRRSHTSRYTSNTNHFHHVTDHELSDLLARHQIIKKKRTQSTTDIVPRPVTRIPSETDFGDEGPLMETVGENEQDPEVSFAAEGTDASDASEEDRLRRDIAQMSKRLAEIEAAKCSAKSSLRSADYTDEDASGASTDGRGHMDRDRSCRHS